MLMTLTTANPVPKARVKADAGSAGLERVARYGTGGHAAKEKQS